MSIGISPPIRNPQEEMSSCDKLGHSASTISFLETQKDFCVSIVDIVNSTKIAASLPRSKMCAYYTIFLNSMSFIAKKFGATVVKNIGDSLLYYFPNTANSYDIVSFVNALECGLNMIEENAILNQMMEKEQLPAIRYRVSADYGSVMIARYGNSITEDVFGSTVNICAKINPMAKPSSMVIGGDLHNVVKTLATYKFQQLESYCAGLKLQYPVYSIVRNGSR